MCLLWAVHDCGGGFVKRGLAPSQKLLLTPRDDGIHGDGQMPNHRLGFCPESDKCTRLWLDITLHL